MSPVVPPLIVLLTSLLLVTVRAEPTVNSSAGTFHGRYLPEFNQDLFLGIKYAPKPLRFAPSTLAASNPDAIFDAYFPPSLPPQSTPSI